MADKVIWKFPLEGWADGVVEIRVPALGTRPVLVGEQDGTPCLWFEVDPSLGGYLRAFQVVGTGQPTPRGRWLGSWQVPPFVWHMYELTRSAV